MELQKNDYSSPYCTVNYIAEENIVFLVWKQFCCGEEYRAPTLFAVDLLRRFPNSTFVTDARNGFEDSKEDVAWGFSKLLPAMAKTECKQAIFIMNQINEIEEEMDMWTKEFLKYFAVKKVTSYDEAVALIHKNRT